MVGYTIASRPCMRYMQYDNYVKLYEHKASDKELEEVIKDQLLPVDASPIALPSDYISDSDPEEDDEEDPERSSLTISAERRDNDDNESSNDDDDDDDVKDEEDEEEEEHLAPADPSAIPTGDPLHTISSCFLRPNPVQYGCLFNTILHYHHLPKQYEVGWYAGPSKAMEKVRSVAYKLEFPQELSKVHNTFHISNLKKCYSDKPFAALLEGLHINDKLHLSRNQ
ncbi:hypothetical protein Tco_0033807 [Tanacetum coccineum]